MSVNLTKYQVDFSAFTDRPQAANATTWSLDQFRDKSVYNQVLQAFVSEANQLFVALSELAQTRTIAGASGTWLDGIGRIVGQGRETTPRDYPDDFVYWDDNLSGGFSLAVPTDTSAHFMDNSVQFVNGGSVNAGATPTDNDFQDEIIRKILDNMNQNSDVAYVENAIQCVLGILVHIEQTDIRSIVIHVPANTPSWIQYYLSGQSFGETNADGTYKTSPTGTYNRWFFPYPAGLNSVTVVSP